MLALFYGVGICIISVPGTPRPHQWIMWNVHVFYAVAANTHPMTRTERKPIGGMIRDELMRQERGVSWFARKLSCDRSNVYRLFQRTTIDTGLLIRISQLLGHDFFADLSAEVREASSSLSHDPQRK